MIDLSLFRFAHAVEIRYADLDALAHVNNAKYFTYMETARLRYFSEVLGWSGNRNELGVILAQASCDFKIPLVLNDSARVYLRVSKLGHKSFDFDYIILRENGRAVAALAKSVQVAYDYDTGQSIPLPDAWRERIAAFEPGLAT
jgi:acyl-CoA thioester hydrolase